MLKTNTPIQFIDLQAQRSVIATQINEAIERVLTHGAFILGPEVFELEQNLATYCGAKEVIACNDGTNALRLILMAHQVGVGDAVFVPSFTFASTAEVVADCGATPVFVDCCQQSFNLDVKSLQEAIAVAKALQLKPKGIIAVDLFGLPADYDAIHEIASQEKIWVMADAAQSFGGASKNKKVGTLAHASATSFFPSKPLACYGDGGAVFTDDSELADLIRSLRNHGCGKNRYDHFHIGANCRLDTLQAAILIEKLKIFDKELSRRQQIAEYYTQQLQSLVQTPQCNQHQQHAWGLYSIVCKNHQQRENLMLHLENNQISHNIYYRKPLHLQPAYEKFPRASQSLGQCELICKQIISLPMHPYLTNEQIKRVVSVVGEALS